MDNALPEDEASRASAVHDIARPAVSLAALSALGLLLTLAWQLTIAALFGTSSELDAFWIALAIPKAIIDSLHLGLLTLAFILIFNLREGSDSAGRDELVSSVLNLVVGGTFLFVPLLVLAAPYLTKWMAPGLGPDLQRLSARMLQVLGLVLLPTALTGAIAGILNARQRFVPFALARVVALVVQILTLYVLVEYVSLQVGALVWATLLSAVVMLAFCLPAFFRTGFQHRAVLRWRTSGGSEVFKLFAALVAFATLDRLNQVTDRFFASLLAPGSVSALEFGWRFEIPIAHVLSMSVALPSLAIMAGQAAEERWTELRATVATSLRLLTLGVLPLIGFVVVLREPLVILWFQRGAFSPEAAHLISWLIPALAVTWVMRAFGTITVFGLMSLRRLRALLLVLSVEVVTNVGLNFLLIKPLGLQGVVLATALAMAGSGLWVGKLLLDSLDGWSFRSLAWELRKPLGASLGSILFLTGVNVFLGFDRPGNSHLESMIEMGGIGLAYLLVHLFLSSRLGLIELRLDGGLPRLRLSAREWSGRGAVGSAAETVRSKYPT